MHKSMLRSGLVALVLSLGLLAVGCGPKYPNCDNDENCKEKGEFCVDNLCRECGTNDQCVEKTGNKCMVCGTNYTCEKEPGCCNSDLDCPGGKCWKNAGAETGRCGGECRSDQDCDEGEECVGERCVKKTVGCSPACGPGKVCRNNSCEWACEFETVYFDYNESALTSDSRAKLERNAECAKTIGTAVKIAGHCDERGTEEYNLALGERRARAAKTFMSDRGAGNNLSTISYGEEKPVCGGSTESCWSQNRRAEFTVE